MSPTEQIQQIERNIEAGKVAVELNAALQRLLANRDFKAVIADGYLNKEAIRLVHAKSNPSLQTPVHQAAIIRDIDAIGALAQYFNNVTLMGDMAAKGLAADEEARAELLAEGA
jgi:hypothetical protein